MEKRGEKRKIGVGRDLLEVIGGRHIGGRLITFSQYL